MSDENKGHGHEKTYKIIVNGRDKEVNKEVLTFEEVVALAFDSAPAENTIFTVTFRKADAHPDSGTLVAGQKVKIKNGTIFNVTATNRS